MTLKLVSWNVNGIRAAYRKTFTEFLKSYKPDLLYLQETKAHPDQLEDEQKKPFSYQSVFSSAEKKGYSGVACFYNKNIEPKKILHGLGSKKFDSEGRYVVTRINGIDIYNIYFPSGSSGEVRQEYKYKFLNHFLKYLKTLPKSRLEKTIVCGDFNICHTEIDIHHPDTATRLELSGFLPKERKWLDSFSKLGFVDSYRHVNGDIPNKYTWWSYRAGAKQKNLGWRIDYFFVAKSLAKKIKGADILDNFSGSDHCPITLDIDI